jgi:hypothetical protein
VNGTDLGLLPPTSFSFFDCRSYLVPTSSSGFQ